MRCKKGEFICGARNGKHDIAKRLWKGGGGLEKEKRRRVLKQAACWALSIQHIEVLHS